MYQILRAVPPLRTMLLVTIMPALPETWERRCPACQSERIVHAGRVTAGEGTMRVVHQCEACGTAFWFVRKRTKRPLSA